MRLICEGCGQPVPLPEGYRRNKIQCACGVICTVPESARPADEETPAPKRGAAKAKARSAVEEEAERWLLDEPPPAEAPPRKPPRFRDPEPAEPPPAKRGAAEVRFGCRRCGRPVRRQGECPDCDADKLPAEAREEPVFWPSVDEPAGAGEEEDSAPYGVEGADEVKCPKCSFMLPPGSVLCVRCGFHLEKREKITKTYQPIAREWDNGARQARWALFGACEFLALVASLYGVVQGAIDVGTFLGSYLFFTAMMAFLFGTFDHLHLTRDARGKVRLTKTWRVCFFARPPKNIDVRRFEGIVSGQHRPVTSYDSLFFYLLLMSGIIPGVIWWYLVFYKVTYHVSLSRDHGFPEQIVYSGWSEKQMQEIASTLRDATGLRYEDG